MTDFTLAHHGSVAILTPNNDNAKTWLRERIPDDALWFGLGVAIEPRYVDGITAGIDEEGFTLGIA